MNKYITEAVESLNEVTVYPYPEDQIAKIRKKIFETDDEDKVLGMIHLKEMKEKIDREHDDQIRKFLINKYKYDGKTIVVDGVKHNVTINMNIPTQCDRKGNINIGKDFCGKDNDLQYILQHEIGHKTMNHRKIFATEDSDDKSQREVLTPQEALTKMISSCTKKKNVTPEDFLSGPKYRKGLDAYHKIVAWLSIGTNLPKILAGGPVARKILNNLPEPIKNLMEGNEDLLVGVASLFARYNIKKPSGEFDEKREKNLSTWNKEAMRSPNMHVTAMEAEADTYAVAHMDPRTIAHMKHPLEPLAKIYGFKIHDDGDIEIPQNVLNNPGFIRQFGATISNSKNPNKFSPLVDYLARTYKVAAFQDLKFRIDAYDKTSNTKESKIYKDINPRKVDRAYEYEDTTPSERKARQEEIARRSADGYRRREELAKSIKEKENKK